MDVKLLAYTMLTEDALDILEQSHDTTSPADHLAELAGRACYQSFHRPNPKTADNDNYMANIIRQDHTSTFEHASVSFYITGVSRSLTHELIRHRHLSYSQQSQRYVDEGDSTFIRPALMQELMSKYEPGFDAGTNSEAEDELVMSIYNVENVADASRNAYKRFVTAAANLAVAGRKEIRQAARAILPGNTDTRIVVSGNIRAWRHFLHMRHSVHADAEIQELAKRILAQLRKLAPAAVQDISDEPRN